MKGVIKRSKTTQANIWGAHVAKLKSDATIALALAKSQAKPIKFLTSANKKEVDVYLKEKIEQVNVKNFKR